MSTVTIVIPFVGNSYDLLLRAVSSVIHQSIPSWELIVLDNCCDAGGIRQVVEGLQHDRIKYCSTKRRLPISESFNRCLRLANTNLVTILHYDDELTPDFCKLVLEGASHHPNAAGFFVRAREVSLSGKRTFSLRSFVRAILARWNGNIRLVGEAGVTRLCFANFVTGPAICFQKRIIQGECFSAELTQVMDLELNVRLLMQNKELIGLGQCGYLYRRHSSQQTRRNENDTTRFVEEFKVLNAIADRCNQVRWKRAAKAARRRIVPRAQLFSSICRDLSTLQISGGFRKLRILIEDVRTIS